MKQHMSVWMMAARETVTKLVGILLLLAAGQMGTFYYSFQQCLRDRQAQIAEQLAHPEWGVAEIPYPTVEDVLTRGPFTVETVWIIAFLLLCIVLAANGTSHKNGSQYRYTLQRLSIRERTVCVDYAIYNLAVLIIFWAFSALMAMVMIETYPRIAEDGYMGAQIHFLATYRVELFHSLLPLEETTRWLRNGSIVVSLALFLSVSRLWRNGAVQLLVSKLPLLLLAVNFAQPVGAQNSDGIWGVLGIAVTAWLVWYLISTVGKPEGGVSYE